MDLGQGIRKALAAITGAALVDEKAVKAFSKDIQRVLITNDVEVRLVSSLCKKIEERILNEKIRAGSSIREHATRVVYEELCNLMGGEAYVPTVEKKKILLLGLFGSGKCVHPDTLIPTADGKVSKIAELWAASDGEEEPFDEGTIKELTKPLDVFSFDPMTLKMTRGLATHVWKLEKTDPLLKIGFDAGNDSNITVTPEHPFFVLENGTIRQVRADGIRVGQLVSAPRTLEFHNNFNLKQEVIQFICKEKYMIRDVECAKAVKNFLLGRFSTLTAAHEAVRPNIAYCTFTANLKAGIVTGDVLSACTRLGFMHDFGTAVTVKSKNSDKFIQLPLLMSAPLCELLGYVFGDGHLEKNYIEITNEDDEIVEHASSLSKSLFNVDVSIRRDTRAKHLYRVVLASESLVRAFNKIFRVPVGKKSNLIFVPEYLFVAPKPHSAAFLQAYFDCDGHIGKDIRSIEFATASEKYARDLRYLLLKHDISSTISVKEIRGRKYWRVMVIAAHAELFAREIGSIVPFKQARLLQCAKIGEGHSLGKRETLMVGPLLKRLREHYGASIGEIQKHVNAYGNFEKDGRISRESLRRFLKAISKTKNKNNIILSACRKGAKYPDVERACAEPAGWVNASLYRLVEQNLIACNGTAYKTTQKGIRCLTQSFEFDAFSAYKSLQALAESDIEWVSVKSIALEDSTQYVYDLTVEHYHNFVANGVIVHNTTSVAKLAKYYHSKGLRVAAIAGDVHRPAAIDQLEQVCKSVNAGFYADRSHKDAARIARQGLENLGSQYDVIIVDTAGRSAFDEELAAELKNIDNAIKADEKFLVISADIGQVAARQAKQFDSAVGLTGVIITKMDGSGKGGGALSAVAASQAAKIAFIASGEKPDAFEAFDAKKFVARLCGFPDLDALLSKAKEMSSEENLQKAMEEGKLDYETFLAQMKAMKKMGPLKQIMQMVGAYDLPEEMVGKSEEKMKSFESAINSMTPAERKDPKLMKIRTRQERVAKGSGQKMDEVREMIDNFDRVQKMMKGMRGNRGFLKGIQKMMPGAGMK